MPGTRQEIIDRLKQDILLLQGFKPADSNAHIDVGLGAIEDAFPRKTFAFGAIHEFISYEPEAAVATNGFISAIAGRLMQNSGFAVWVSARPMVFPPTLQLFGVPPERVLFADVRTNKDALWTIEEALKCDALTAVFGELPELSFSDSRRLQLAVERSRVTGFIHRNNPKTENTTACLTRWKIKPVASLDIEDMPGIGFPCWDVQLVKVRNGVPGQWLVEWRGTFRHVRKSFSISQIPTRKTG